MENKPMSAEQFAKQFFKGHRYIWHLSDVTIEPIIKRALTSFAEAKVQEDREKHNNNVQVIVEEIRNAALEEAAKVCHDKIKEFGAGAQSCEHAIRQLKAGSK